jgi:hypothetical protein
MIRPFTCLCMLLAASAGLYVYQEKHRAQVLDREIMRVVKATETARDRTGMLRAEWALLNEPERLASLADRHLALKPLSPTQFVQLADLGNRLPAPVAPGTPAPAMDEAAPLEPVAPLATVAPIAAVVVPAAPVKAAAAVKPPAPAVQVAAAKPVHLTRLKPAEVFETASALPSMAALPPPRPIYAPFVTPVAAHAPTVQRIDAMSSSSGSIAGSSLGMARTTLPPPVPVSAASTFGSSTR